MIWIIFDWWEFQNRLEKLKFKLIQNLQLYIAFIPFKISKMAFYELMVMTNLHYLFPLPISKCANQITHFCYRRSLKINFHFEPLMRIEALRRYLFPALKALDLLFCIFEGLVGRVLKMRGMRQSVLTLWHENNSSSTFGVMVNSYGLQKRKQRV